MCKDVFKRVCMRKCRVCMSMFMCEVASLRVCVWSSVGYMCEMHVCNGAYVGVEGGYE